MLSALSIVCTLLFFISYKIHTKAVPGHGWHITNDSSWTILARDFDTGAQKSIQPLQSITIDRGSTGRLEVNNSHDQFTFDAQSSRVTILEPFKGQLTLREDDIACPECYYTDFENECADCRFCDCNGNGL